MYVKDRMSERITCLWGCYYCCRYSVYVVLCVYVNVIGIYGRIKLH